MNTTQNLILRDAKAVIYNWFRCIIVFLLLFACQTRDQIHDGNPSKLSLEGGRTVNKLDYGPTVAIMLKQPFNTDKKHFCTAARIGQLHYLTAGHCILNGSTRTIWPQFISGSKITLFFASHKTDDAQFEKDVTIDFAVAYPRYFDNVEYDGGFWDSRTTPDKVTASDVGIIKVKEHIDEKLVPVGTILSDFEVKPDTAIRIGGYGNIGKDQPNQNLELKYEQVKVSKTFPGYFTFNNIVNIQGVNQVVRLRPGDSGGPVYINQKVYDKLNKREYFGQIIGVNAFSSPELLTDDYSAFTRLDALIPGSYETPGEWLADVVKNKNWEFPINQQIQWNRNLVCNHRGAQFEFNVGSVPAYEKDLRLGLIANTFSAEWFDKIRNTRSNLGFFRNFLDSDNIAFVAQQQLPGEAVKMYQLILAKYPEHVKFQLAKVFTKIPERPTENIAVGKCFLKHRRPEN